MSWKMRRKYSHGAWQYGVDQTRNRVLHLLLAACSCVVSLPSLHGDIQRIYYVTLGGEIQSVEPNGNKVRSVVKPDDTFWLQDFEVDVASGFVYHVIFEVVPEIFFEPIPTKLVRTRIIDGVTEFVTEAPSAEIALDTVNDQVYLWKGPRTSELWKSDLNGDNLVRVTLPEEFEPAGHRRLLIDSKASKVYLLGPTIYRIGLNGEDPERLFATPSGRLGPYEHAALDRQRNYIYFSGERPATPGRDRSVRSRYRRR